MVSEIHILLVVIPSVIRSNLFCVEGYKKVFDCFWHLTLIFKCQFRYLSFSFGTVIIDFFSGRSTAADSDSHLSSFNIINIFVSSSSSLLHCGSAVPHNYLSITPSVYPFTDDTTLRLNIIFDKYLAHQEMEDAKKAYLGQLTSDLSLFILLTGIGTTDVFNASESQFFYLSSRGYLLDIYHNRQKRPTRAFFAFPKYSRRFLFS